MVVEVLVCGLRLLVHLVYMVLSWFVDSVWAHMGIMGNEIVDAIANEGKLKEKPSATPHIHLAHATLY